MAKSPDENTEEKEMTLLGHLEELRWRLIIAVGTLAVAVCVCFFFAGPVLEVLIMPMTTMGELFVDKEKEKAPEPAILRFVVDPGSGALRVTNPEALAAAANDEPPAWGFVITGDDASTRTLIMGGEADVGPKTRLIYTNPLDPFMMRFKVAIVVGILFALPVWVWQIWLFMAPGLTKRERKVVGPMLVSAIGLFPLGAGFAYAMLFMIVIVMGRYTVGGIETLNSIREYLKLLTNMMIVFGLIFELPLVVALMARVGIVTPAFLRHYRRHIYVGLAFLSMFMTPADPWTMMAALVPLIGLFEVSIFIAAAMALIRARDEDEPDESPA